MRDTRINRMKNRAAIRKIYNEPSNRRLKYIALAIATVIIIIQLILILMIDTISINTLLILRGCIGTLACIFVIICGILVYRVNRSHIRQRRHRHIDL